ncbi:hypothetical protein B0H13DRAFT_2358549 [Mycena leptocephala]|nr:hypothetical protein B0H13DRAFT_2358549 [Mycena leptocephala]
MGVRITILILTVFAARRSNQALAPPSSHSSHTAAGKDFDWTNTKKRTDVCYRCGLPGRHFAQYCVSMMPDDVQSRILRNRERQAYLADNEDSDNECGPANLLLPLSTDSHIAAADFDLPFEINIDIQSARACSPLMRYPTLLTILVSIPCLLPRLRPSPR